jgi:hypothetical protein
MQRDTTVRTNKNKQSTKIKIKPNAKKTHNYEMTINNTKENPK